MDYLSFLTIRVENNPQHPDWNNTDYIIRTRFQSSAKAESILAESIPKSAVSRQRHGGTEQPVKSEREVQNARLTSPHIVSIRT